MSANMAASEVQESHENLCEENVYRDRRQDYAAQEDSRDQDDEPSHEKQQLEERDNAVVKDMALP